MGSFNSYIDSSDVEFWKNLCIKSGKLSRYKAGDIFVEEGQKNQYLGLLLSAKP